MLNKCQEVKIMEFKKSELTAFAKECSKGAYYMVTGICHAEEITHSDLGRKLRMVGNDYENELLIEVAKRYAKYCRYECDFDLEVGETQDFQNIISSIVNCCDEHNWFREEM